ncbi:MAG: hypothetical protein CL570_05705 [Alphaproteobacteria bacterium]|nr:hypothetical protein [Alphaproteobacteria bacterium]HCQ70974.1 hypothetical protein [Rhodospirillaceae bacterium]|tara:strand:+ start:15205 stop:15906 length:702 start_codon:yes stop_codon:yes gene_type:complete
MINIYPLSTLGHANHGWLDTHYHFSFANYFNKKRMHFGQLRVINDDSIKAGAGFDMHRHENMEIITFVRSGAITHQDSKGNTGRTKAGDVQVMSAGSGIYHSEFNLESETTTLFQIWIKPNKKDVTPRWDMANFNAQIVQDALPLLVSGRGEDQDKGALFIHQDAAIYGGKLAAGQVITHPIKDQAYILISKGHADIDGHAAAQGDGIEITQQDTVTIKATDTAEIILIDVPA